MGGKKIRSDCHRVVEALVSPLSGKDHNSLTYFLSGFDVNSFLLRVVLIPKLIIFPANSLNPGGTTPDTTKHTNTHTSHIIITTISVIVFSPAISPRQKFDKGLRKANIH